MAAKISKQGMVEGKRIAVFDDLVEAAAVQRLAASLEQSGFIKSEVARPETRQFKHWAVNIPEAQTQQLPIYAPTMEAVAVFAGGEGRYRMYRSYCNFAAYGDMLFIHTDAQPGSRELTVLWFIAPEWNPEWGGETLFFNTALDAEYVVSPRPGRLVVFDGAIPHVGRPPNRICFAPRYTFAMKFEAIADAR